MKTAFTITCALLSAFAVSTALAQTTYTWIGSADGTNLTTAGNWTTDGINPATSLPNGTSGDIAQWDGRTATNLSLTYGGSGWPGTGTPGVSLVLTANQTNSVQIAFSIPLSAPLSLFGVTNNSASASIAFTVNSGTLFVNGANAAGATIVNAGTLAGTGTFSGPVTMNAGSTLAPGAANSVGTLTINNDLTIGGNLEIDVNRKLSPSNDFVVVTGVLTNTGVGTVGIIRLGSQSLAQQGKYALFSKPLQNGAALYVVGEDVPWTNNLAVDGSISLSSFPLNYTWTGAVDGTNLVDPGNFTVDGIHPNTNLPSGLDGTGIQESAIWNGLTTSNLVLIFGGSGWGNTGLGTIGNNLITTTNQTNSVQIVSQAPRSPSMGFFAITNNSSSGAFILGDGTTNDLFLVFRPNGVLHHFVNNSTAACIINPNVEWQAGGGNGITYDFGGTGNWIVNNYLMPDNGAFQPSTVQVDGPGTVFWSAGAVGMYNPNSFLSNIVINGGALVLKSAFPGNNNQLLKTAIAVSTSLTYAPTNCTNAQTLNGNISGSGQLMVNGGTLTLGGSNTYSGTTSINAGKLVFQGVMTGTGNITVANGDALGIYDTGTQVTPDTLTLGTGVTLEFNNITNTTKAPLAPNTLVSGPITINVNGGPFTVGQSYPLLTWTSGSAPAVTLGANNGGNTLSTNGNTILFNVLAVPLVWTGTNNGSWDTTTTGNWLQNGGPVLFTNGNPTLFDDTASGTTAVTVNALVQPAFLTISNSTLAYSIASSGGNNIAGATGLTKEGTNTLTLSGGTNTYTGPTTISSGTVIVSTLANGGSASDIGAADSTSNSLVLNGGALRYTGAATGIDRLFTVGTAGGTIDASGTGALLMTNPGTIRLGGPLTLAGSSSQGNTLAATLVGSNGLNKVGTGAWVLTGANTYGGGTTISGGELEVVQGGALGGGDIIDNAVLYFDPSSSLIVNGAISGTGSLQTAGSGTVILAANNSYSGGTTINAGSTLQIGNLHGPTGELGASGSIVDYGVLFINTSGSFALNGVISGPGALTVEWAGTLTLNAENTYTGLTIVNTGTLIVNGGNASSSIIVNGTLGGRGRIGGPVTFDPGSYLAPSASGGSPGTLTFSNNVNFAGNLLIETDKSHTRSNDYVVVGGTLNNTGTGTVSVRNRGPALAVGDKFTLFSKPMVNGDALTVTGAGATWQNNLAVDGSIMVTSVSRPTLNLTPIGTNVQLSWDSSFGNFRLQVQTNGPGVGLGSNWVVYSGTNPVTIVIDPTQGSVFFRLAASNAVPTSNSIDVTSGTSGLLDGSTSYNETRAVDVTVMSPADLVVSSMTLSGIYGSGLAKAVIYDSNTQTLIASAQGTLTGGTITLPISATLNSGGEYRIGFYGLLGGGTAFEPSSYPYIESSGLLQINSAWEIATDSFPSIPNLDVPFVSLQLGN